MGLGHVINIKHMVFSRIRFNSRQLVQEQESDVGGECLGSVLKHDRNRQPVKKKWKAEPGSCCWWPSRGTDGSLACLLGWDWEAALWSGLRPALTFQSGSQLLCDQWPSCWRQHGTTVENGSFVLAKGNSSKAREIRGSSTRQEENCSCISWFSLHCVLVQPLWHITNSPHPQHSTITE